MNPAGGARTAMSLFVGGILPVIAFTLIEDNYGTWAGLVAGMVFGVGEIAWELFKYRKVSQITWFGNGMLLGLGAVSLWLDDGIWFKLQPAIMEAVFTLALWGSVAIKRPLLIWLAEAQGQTIPEQVKDMMPGFTFRIGCFFAVHAALATHAAYNWSSNAWAALKGIGLTVSFIIYVVLEGFYMRWTLKKKLEKAQRDSQATILK